MIGGMRDDTKYSPEQHSLIVITIDQEFVVTVLMLMAAVSVSHYHYHHHNDQQSLTK